MDPVERAAHLLELHTPGAPLLAPNPWDIGSAKLLESLGFEALCTTSSGAAAAQGGLDGSLDRDQAIASAGAIATAVTVPVSADLENGFGDDPSDTAETIRLAMAAGLSGGSIEDYTLRADDPIYPIEQPRNGWRPPRRWHTPTACSSCSRPAPRTTCAAAMISPTRSPACRRTR